MNERQPNSEQLSNMIFDGNLLVFGWEEDGSIRYAWGIEDDEVKEAAKQRNIVVPPYELFDGDKLTVFAKNHTSEVIWEGLLDFKLDELDKVAYSPSNISQEDWLKWTKEHYPARLQVGKAGFDRQMLRNQLEKTIHSIDRFQSTVEEYLRNKPIQQDLNLK